MDVLKWSNDTENSNIIIDHDFIKVEKTGLLNSAIVLWKVITGKATILLNDEKGKNASPKR